MRATTTAGALVLGMLLAVFARSFHAAPAAPTGVFDGAVVNHFGVVVRDVDLAVPAYADLFGVMAPMPREFKPVEFPTEFAGDRDAHPKYAMLQLGGSGMEVMTPVGGPSPWREFLDAYGEGMQHITFTVRSAPQAVAHLEKLGGRHEMGTANVGYAYVNFRKQLGFTVELGQNANPTPVPTPAAATSLGTSPVRHLGVVVADAQKAATLFATILGVDLPPVQPSRDPRIKTIVFPLNVGIEFIEPVGGASPWRDHLNKYGPSIHHVAVSVDDMKKYSSYLEGKGGRLVSSPAAGYSVFDLRPRYALGIELDGR
jgi:catechol 2,3-dioxygenase-like lactoylglutathione lyase family enzyme